jgi:3-hydroxyisobutyrate dehydrogenase
MKIRREVAVSEAVGFIGVGSMGSALAGRLVDTYSLHIYDLNRAAADELVEKGAIFAAPQEIARACNFVLTSLPGPTDVRDLLLAEDGLIHHLAPGSVVIDTTTGTPTMDAKIAAALGSRSIQFSDVGVAGGVRGVRAGSGTLMVGASPETYALIDVLLHCITPTVFHMGGVGGGHTIKLVNNLMNTCHRFAALEAIRLGEAGGLSRQAIIEVLNKSTGRSYITEYTFTQLLDGDTWKPQGFTIDLMRKDVGMATELAKAFAQQTPIGDLVQGFLDIAIERLGPRADLSQMMAEWHESRT